MEKRWITLIINTNSLAKKLSEKTNYSVEIAMRYQYPSINEAIEKLINKGCKEINCRSPLSALCTINNINNRE